MIIMSRWYIGDRKFGEERERERKKVREGGRERGRGEGVLGR